MKILLVAPLYPPYALGGGGAVTSAIAMGLAKHGHTVTVLAGCYSKRSFTAKPHKEKIEGIEIIWLPLIRMMETKYPQLRGSMPPNIPSLAFLKTLDYNSYDVIHLSAFGHILIDCVNLLAKNQKKILTIHAFPKYFEKKGKASRSLKFLYRVYSQTLGKHTLKSAKMITAISKFTLDESIKKGVQKDKIKLIENGLDLQKNRPVKYHEFEKKYNLEREDIVFLSVSRITWHKGYEYAIDAIHRLVKSTGKSIKYLVTGSIEDQKYFSKLEKQIQTLSLNKTVTFTGFLSDNMKLQALSRSDIFLAPSLHEGFGLVLLEAMAMGKPIVASNCEGFQQIIKHMTNGLLVEPASSKEIANSILLLLSDSSLLEKLSKNALDSVKKYSWVERVREYEALYKELK
jgi:phosphatidylinositol alpha-mannosyltransferase